MPRPTHPALILTALILTGTNVRYEAAAMSRLSYADIRAGIPAAALSFLTVLIRYLSLSHCIRCYYYQNRSSSRHAWKIQPTIATKPPTFQRRIFRRINLFAGSLSAATCAVAIHAGAAGSFSFDMATNALHFIAATVWQAVVEYHWHRLMHRLEKESFIGQRVCGE